MDVMDVECILTSFSWGLVILEGIQLIFGGPVAGVEEMVGMAFYPVFYNIYQTSYSQLPANALHLQTAVNQSFQNYINYISQAQNYATSVNTLVMTLLISIFMSVFIIVLEILMRLVMPRTEGPSGY
jgi:hypothetical protein